MAVYPTEISLEADLGGGWVQTSPAWAQTSPEWIANEGWIDVSADVDLGAETLDVEYGIRDGGPLDRVASTGTATWAMKNSTKNSGGLLGYYTPGHANARSGWEVGIPIRFSALYGGTRYVKFRGTLVEVVPEGGEYARRVVHCKAHDWIDTAARCLLKEVAIQLNKRSDQLVTTLVAACSPAPTATSYETGQSTFAFALDNLRDESTVSLRALTDVVFSEMGFLYQKGDGTLRFEDRHFRSKAASVATFNKTMFEIEAIRARDDVYNHAVVLVHPRKVDAAATTVLYELTPTESVPSLLPGQSVAITGYFRESAGRYARIGADALVTPVATTDYLGNAAEDGSGADLTSSLSVVFTFTSNAGTFLVTNNHATATVFITKLQVRGKAVQDRYEAAVTADNATSQAQVGDQDVAYDMLFEDRLLVAKDVADLIVNLYGNLRVVLKSMGLHANSNDTLMTQVLTREPGDKITVTEAMSGLSAVKYFVNGVRLTVQPGKLIDASWVLAPSSQEEFWILEDAALGLLEQTTVLGFG